MREIREDEAATVLFNRLYKGELVWGRTKKRDASGRRKESNRPADEWILTTAEPLRIVSDELWATAHEALESRQKAYGFKHSSAIRTGRQPMEMTIPANSGVMTLINVFTVDPENQ